MDIVKNLLRKAAASLPFALTKNIAYDKQTAAIMKQVLQPDSNCIDIGCHKGEVLEEILKLSPNGRHFGFEPLPDFYDFLKKEFEGKAQFFNLALSDSSGEISFNYVKSNPAYSGIQKRQYPGEEKVEEISVKTERLDSIISDSLKIDLIKIDVEGAEMQVLRGSEKLLKRDKPVVVFEHGLGAADHYNTKPEEVHAFLLGQGLQVNTLKGFLNNSTPLDEVEFGRQFREGINYYFVAYP